MSAGACARLTGRLSGDHYSGVLEKMRRWAKYLRAILLPCLVLAVVGAMSLRHTRRMTLARDEEMAQRLDDGRYGTFRTQPVSRADFAAEAPSWHRLLNSLPASSNREQVMSAVPVGRSYEVLVNGGVTGRSPDMFYRPMHRRYMAYMFEMRYQRTIESNNGCRIVERRTYGSVRTAKILSSAGVNLKLPPPDVVRLDCLDYPEAGGGIAVAPVRPVAEAILERGATAVVDDSTSRAFLEQHLLSGKSVRLTYVVGVGMSSIEPLGWTLTKSVAAHLFTQTVLPPPLPTSDSLGRPLTDFILPPAEFTAFLDPTQFFSSGCTREIGLRVVPGVNESGVACELSLLPGTSIPELPYAVREYRRSPAVPLGRLQYDPHLKTITRALIEWPRDALRISHDQLLFELEKDWGECRPLTVQYCCRAH